MVQRRLLVKGAVQRGQGYVLLQHVGTAGWMVARYTICDGICNWTWNKERKERKKKKKKKKLLSVKYFENFKKIKKQKKIWFLPTCILLRVDASKMQYFKWSRMWLAEISFFVIGAIGSSNGDGVLLLQSSSSNWFKKWWFDFSFDRCVDVSLTWSSTSWLPFVLFIKSSLSSSSSSSFKSSEEISTTWPVKIFLTLKWKYLTRRKSVYKSN